MCRAGPIRCSVGVPRPGPAPRPLQLRQFRLRRHLNPLARTHRRSAQNTKHTRSSHLERFKERDYVTKRKMINDSIKVGRTQIRLKSARAFVSRLTSRRRVNHFLALCHHRAVFVSKLESNFPGARISKKVYIPQYSQITERNREKQRKKYERLF